jgi:hypothetical protein
MGHSSTLPAGPFCYVGAVRLALFVLVVVGSAANPVLAAAGDRAIIHADMEHLRSGQAREWTDFPQTSLGDSWLIPFEGTVNTSGFTLFLRQKDVQDKRWSVFLNGKRLGTLLEDERGLIALFAVPPGSVREGRNEVRIAATGAGARSDDILVGDVRLIGRPPSEILNETRVSIEVIDRATQQRIPARVSIADTRGFMAPVTSAAPATQATRTGVVYTANGLAEFFLPAGAFTVYASRGFEYGVDSFIVRTKPGDRIEKRLRIDREAPVPGYIACDTHIHTLELSGHGDASVAERVIDIAGEGVELAVATEHNKHAFYSAAQHSAGLDQYFTTVAGNEVTTRLDTSVFSRSTPTTLRRTGATRIGPACSLPCGRFKA